MAVSIKDRQDRFIIEFEESISIAQCCRSLNESYGAVMQWKARDTMSFRVRFTAANERRLDNLEERMFNVIEWATKEENFKDALRYPTLLMFALKAGRPMYRDSVQVATGAADLIAAISKLDDVQVSPAQVDSPLDVPESRRNEGSLSLTTAQERRLKSKLDTNLRGLLGSEE